MKTEFGVLPKKTVRLYVILFKKKKKLPWSYVLSIERKEVFNSCIKKLCRKALLYQQKKRTGQDFEMESAVLILNS